MHIKVYPCFRQAFQCYGQYEYVAFKAVVAKDVMSEACKSGQEGAILVAGLLNLGCGNSPCHVHLVQPRAAETMKVQHI